MMRHLMLAVVTYDGLIEPPTRACLRAATQSARERGWQTTPLLWAGDGLIAHARNGAAAAFLRSECTDLMFVDSDIAWDGDALCKLAEYPVDMVAGAYRYRREIERYSVTLLPQQMPNVHGLLEALQVATGMLRISRACLERMVDYYADRIYRDENGTAWSLFETGLLDGAFCGEDVWFCRRWRDIGGQVWVDPSITTHHLGCAEGRAHSERRTYSGCIGEWLSRQEKAA